MGKVLIRPIFILLANMVALLVAAWALPQTFSVSHDFWSLLWISFLLMLLNLFVRPFLTLILGPIILLTLGLASILVNALVLYLLDILTTHLTITGVPTLILAALIIGIINAVLGHLYKT